MSPNSLCCLSEQSIFKKETQFVSLSRERLRRAPTNHSNVGKIDAMSVSDPVGSLDQLWSGWGGGVFHFCLEGRSLDFSKFSQCVDKHLSRWVHFLFTPLPIRAPCGLQGGALMNLWMLKCTSLCPLWSGQEKWWPTDLSWSPKKMSWRWRTNMFFILNKDLSNILYATFVACACVNRIGAYGRDFCYSWELIRLYGRGFSLFCRRGGRIYKDVCCRGWTLSHLGLTLTPFSEDNVNKYVYFYFQDAIVSSVQLSSQMPWNMVKQLW